MATTDLTTNTPTGYQAGGRVNGLNCGSHHSRTEAFPVMDVSANLVSDIMLKPSGDATSPTSTTPNDPIKKARLAWRTRCDEQARRAAARHRRYMARLRAATLQRQRDAARATRRAERRTAATKALTNNVEVTRRRHRHVVLEIRARARERHACTKDTRTRARVHKRHARAQSTRVEYTREVHTCGVHMRTPRCMARVIALLLLALTATILTSCDTTSPTTWICAPGAPRTSVRGAPNCASHRDTRRHQRTREEPARCLAAHTLGDGPTTRSTAHAHARGHTTDASNAGVSQTLRLPRHLTHTKDTSALIDLPTHAITGVSHVGRDIVNVPVAASVDANALPTPTLLPHHRLRALSRRHGTDTPNTIDLTHWRAATPLRLTMAISRLYALYALYKCPALTGAVADVLHRALDTDHFAHAVERARANVASLLQCQLLRLRALGSFQSETSAWSKLYAEPHGSALALGYKPPPDERTNAYGGPHFANRRACGHYTLAVTQALLRLLFAKILDRHGLLYYTTHARVANAVPRPWRWCNYVDWGDVANNGDVTPDDLIDVPVISSFVNNRDCLRGLVRRLSPSPWGGVGQGIPPNAACSVSTLTSDSGWLNYNRLPPSDVHHVPSLATSATPQTTASRWHTPTAHSDTGLGDTSSDPANTSDEELDDAPVHPALKSLTWPTTSEAPPT